MPSTDSIANRAGRAFTFVFLFCFGVVGFALYLQHWKNLDPCPWCVAQRIAFLVIGLVALTAALHRPRGVGVTLYGIVGAVLALGGIAMAAYQIYLQGDPARAQACVGSPIEKILDATRLGKMVPPVFMYDGPCTLKPWSLLGLSIPEWSLAAFVIVLVAAIAIPWWARR